ncbi:hypothetical protein PO909_008775 [Leuciscus waleckii]
MFAGFIQEPAGLRPHVSRHGEPEEPSLSLHSSPSSLHGSGLTPSPSPLEEPESEPGDQNEGGEPSEGGGGEDELSVETSAVVKTGPGDTQQHNNNDTAKVKDTTEKASRITLSKSGGSSIFILRSQRNLTTLF